MNALVSAPVVLSLPSDGVHVWYAWLDRPSHDVERFRQVLAAEEQGRAERFHFECDRSRWIVGRGLLRTILACYLSADPRALGFAYGARGKPMLATRNGDARLSFNLSHAENLAVYAIGQLSDIGVDVERVRPIPELEQIAETFFSPAERSALVQLPVSRRQLGFFNCWTRKEAYIKATGDGLAHPLDSFDVTLGPDQPATLLRVDGAPWQPSDWSLTALAPSPGFRGALAVRGIVRTISCRWWLE